jgi:bifunctional non-homologous end joining protein LigD
MRLVRRPRPFDHPDWIFELKLDGFRALAHFENGRAELVSRKGNTFASFRKLASDIAGHFKGENGILDGEIVYERSRWAADAARGLTVGR